VAARGRKCEPLPVERITDHNGRPNNAATPKCVQVIPQRLADAVADAARCPVGDPAHGACAAKNGVTAASVGRTIDRPIAGKTGTTDSNRSAWFVGFTPNLAGAAFYVDPDSPTNSSVPNSKVPIRVFAKAMEGSLKYLPVANFVPPIDKYMYGVRARVPDVRGLTLAEARSRLRSAGFEPTVADKPEDSKYPAGRVSHTDPAGGDLVPKGSSVTVYISTGKQPGAKPPGKPKPPKPRPPIIRIPGWPPIATANRQGQNRKPKSANSAKGSNTAKAGRS
jgi:membrane peptidoglycan carboxypeptidase